MLVLTTASELASCRDSILVPTMGALHEGHRSLVRQARAAADDPAGAWRTPRGKPPVLVTIFVNPTQFGPSEDFAKYPRTLDDDLRACEAAGADVVFAPPVDEVYPPADPPRTPTLPPVATAPGLEDAARPTHFAGVCQVVLRLFDLTRPAAAIFGEKDWQQLQVVRAMVEQEELAIRIIPGVTVREADGLAMSSRNRFLSTDERLRARALSESLALARSGEDPDDAERLMARRLAAAGIRPDYAVVRNASTLAPRHPGEWDRAAPMRAVVAGRVGPVRLLDNAPWSPLGEAPIRDHPTTHRPNTGASV